MRPELFPHQAHLVEALGPEEVTLFLTTAPNTGRMHLPGGEDLVFGFIQRVLIRMQQDGHYRGRIFPKFDATYQRMFDYMDADGTVWVVRPGDGPGEVPNRLEWFRDQDLDDPEQAYFEVVEGADTAIVLAFLEALAHLKGKQKGAAPSEAAP